MKTARHLKQVSLALAVLSSLGAIGAAHAAGTAADQDISTQATVSYSVSGIAQTPIESSPTGNTTPGAGAPTVFEVDRRIFMSVADVPPTPATTTPGATAVVRAFTVINTSNAPVGFALTPNNVASPTDNFDVTITNVFVDSAPASIGSYTPGTYDVGTDTATTIANLPADTAVTVYVLANIPATATNSQFANITLQATAVEPTGSTLGTPGTAITETAGPETPSAVDTVLGDAGRDGIEIDTNTYTISSAALSVTKTANVISDPFNGTTDPRAIPGAVVEYTVEVENTGAAAADNIGLTDTLDGNLTFLDSGVSGADIEIAVSGGGPTTTCTSDADTDGCTLAADTLTIDGTSAVAPDIPAGETATIRFRVTID